MRSLLHVRVIQWFASLRYVLTSPHGDSLSLWYPRYMLQTRIAIFWAGATFAGAFSGLLAYGISFMSGTGGLLGWSWIFVSGRHPPNAWFSQYR